MASNEAAGFTQRKLIWGAPESESSPPASMRPPVLPSGNDREVDDRDNPGQASMRPAGFTQRKLTDWTLFNLVVRSCFNEAAGFTQPETPGAGGEHAVHQAGASMRPPVLPSETRAWRGGAAGQARFNEAAGFTQRKLRALRGFLGLLGQLQ